MSSPPQLAAWEFAGLYLTYWCNSRCAFCYVRGGPDRGAEMGVATAVRLWCELEEHARQHGAQMRVHLAGGEPFGDWTRLVALLRAARDGGLAPVEKIETNAGWATDDGLTRARLELLSALGMERLVVSCDVFHQEFVPLECVQRCVRMAREVLGRGRLIVRWWDFFQQPLDTRTLSPAEREAAFRVALQQHPDRLTGRAAERLAPLLPGQPAEAFRGQNCAADLLGSRHVHVDALGNIFPGTCSGIILGQAGPLAGCSIGDVWQRLASDWRARPVLAALVAGGSFDLLAVARKLGYGERPAGYASKCHLCAHIRQFLFAHGVWPECIGPAACYAP
jgi:hypothetical protein